LSVVPRTTREHLGVGYFLLTTDGPALSSLYVGGRGDLMYWNVSTGKQISIEYQEFIFVTQWSMGLPDTSGLFFPLLKFPDDFVPSENKR
jgi:hypothetical protein